MKGYYPPEKLEPGHCFICNQECDTASYCHFDCAVSYAEARERKMKEAKNKLKDGE